MTDGLVADPQWIADHVTVVNGKSQLLLDGETITLPEADLLAQDVSLR